MLFDTAITTISSDKLEISDDVILLNQTLLKRYEVRSHVFMNVCSVLLCAIIRSVKLELQAQRILWILSAGQMCASYFPKYRRFWYLHRIAFFIRRTIDCKID